MFFVTALSAVASYASELMASAVIVTVISLTFRDDLAAERCATVNRASEAKDEQSSAADDHRAWTAVADALTGTRVPATVALQVLVNRVSVFRAERLAPLDKRLEKAERLLSAAVRAKREAWTAHKY